MKFNTKYIKKRIVLGFMVGLLSLTLTGCGESLIQFTQVTLSTELKQRFQENRIIIENLNQVGLISDNEKKTWLDHIDEVEKDTFVESDTGIVDLEIDGGGNVTGNSYRAFSHLQTYSKSYFNNSEGVFPKEYEDILKEQNPEDTSSLRWYAFGNFLASESAFNQSGNADVTSEYNTADSEKSSYDTEYSYISIMRDKKALGGEKNLVLDLDFSIKVLKPDADIDKVMEITSNTSNINYTLLDEQFQTVKDDDGNEITLSDLGAFNLDNLIGPSEFKGTSVENRPGWDLPIYQTIFGQNLYVGSIKFYEFNKDTIDEIYKFIGIDHNSNIDTDKWIIRKKGTGGQNTIYLMEYPVYYVSGFQDLTNSDGSIDKSKIEAHVIESDLSINLMTGNLIYVKENKASVITSKGDPYLTLGNTLDIKSEDGLSSFILNGYTKIDITEGLSGVNKVEATTGRIILRDYLEATYAPGFETSDTSDLVVLGRKLRLINVMSYEAGVFYNDDNITVRDTRETLIDAIEIKNNLSNSDGSNGITSFSSGSGSAPSSLKWYSTDKLTLNIPLAGEIQTKLVWDKDMPIAKFVNASGEILQDSPELMITDFASVNQLVTDKILLKLSEKNESITAQNPENRLETSTTDSLPISLTQNYIDTTTPFPGNYIGKDDNEADEQKMQQNASAEDSQIHQQFYAMFVATDFFEKGLFTSWLNSPDEEACLGWWVNYLNTNGYLYGLEQGEVEDYLYKNYAYDLSQEGVVILDLKVVEFIQDQMDEQQDEERATWLRTLFRILGVLLIIYSSILMIAWLVDTNADFGFQIVTVMTLGHWIPIKDPDDCPYIDQEKRKYVDFTNVCISSSIMILVGILLLLVDVFDIVLFLIKLLGGLAQEINKMLTGVI